MEEFSEQNVSSQIHMLKSHWQCDGIRSWSFGRRLGHEGDTFMSRVSALENKRDSRELPPSVSMTQ